MSTASDAPACVAASSRSKSKVVVFGAESDEQVAQLDLASEGVHSTRWLDMTLLVFCARKIIMFDVTGQTSTTQYIDRPKWPNESTLAFRSSDTTIAVLERHDGRDGVGVYNEHSILRHVDLPDDANMTSIDWSPCGRFVLLLGGVLHARMIILTPDLRTLFDSGNDAQSVDPIVAHAWHPSGDYLVTLDWTGTLAVRYRVSWLPLELVARQSSLNQSKRTEVYREPRDWREQARGAGIVKCSFSFACVMTFPL